MARSRSPTATVELSLFGIWIGFPKRRSAVITADSNARDSSASTAAWRLFSRRVRRRILSANCFSQLIDRICCTLLAICGVHSRGVSPNLAPSVNQSFATPSPQNARLTLSPDVLDLKLRGLVVAKRRQQLVVSLVSVAASRLKAQLPTFPWADAQGYLLSSLRAYENARVARHRRCRVLSTRNSHKTSNSNSTFNFGSMSTSSFLRLRHPASAMQGHPG